MWVYVRTISCLEVITEAVLTSTHNQRLGLKLEKYHNYIFFYFSFLSKICHFYSRKNNSILHIGDLTYLSDVTYR